MCKHRIPRIAVLGNEDATSIFAGLTIVNPSEVVEVSSKKGFWNPKTPCWRRIRDTNLNSRLDLLPQ